MDKKLFAKVKRLQIKTRHLITDLLSGEYRSSFKGQGMEFDEVREYIPGDDIRAIDWNVTARMNRPFVKIFREERELTVFFMVDVSSSMLLGSGEVSKQELVAELTALLAFTAIQNNDKVGLMLFSDSIEKVILPSKGRKHVLRVIREVLAYKEDDPTHHKRTSIQTALEYLNKIQRRRTVVFLLSDFLDDGYQKSLSVCGRRHDLIAVRIRDALEREFPESGVVPVKDLESGSVAWVDLSSRAIREYFQTQARNQHEWWQKDLKKHRVDSMSIDSDQDYMKTLNAFFRQREKMK